VEAAGQRPPLISEGDKITGKVVDSRHRQVWEAILTLLNFARKARISLNWRFTVLCLTLAMYKDYDWVLKQNCVLLKSEHVWTKVCI
jgi:hypothetical protein